MSYFSTWKPDAPPCNRAERKVIRAIQKLQKQLPSKDVEAAIGYLLDARFLIWSEATNSMKKPG